MSLLCYVWSLFWDYASRCEPESSLPRLTHLLVWHDWKAGPSGPEHVHTAPQAAWLLHSMEGSGGPIFSQAAPGPGHLVQGTIQQLYHLPLLSLGSHTASLPLRGIGASSHKAAEIQGSGTQTPASQQETAKDIV